MEKDLDLARYYAFKAEEYYFGRGTAGYEKDHEMAKSYFQLAAQYGVGELRAEALCNLALLTEDPYAKLALYMEAVEEGCAHAMNMVGVCLERYNIWRGLPIDWYRMAAAHGSACGAHNAALWDQAEAKERQADEERRQAGERKRIEEREAAIKKWLPVCLEAAEYEEPLAIIPVQDVPRLLYNDLAQRAAQELGQSVLLMVKMGGGTWHCVGYDLKKLGLAQAMNNPYQQQECWGLGHYAIGSILDENFDAYCAEVRGALSP